MTQKANKVPRSSVVGSRHIQGNNEVSIYGGNYNENIDGDYVQGNKTDQSRNIKITGGKINVSGAAAFNLGDISGTVAHTINQLPISSNQDKPGIKELLTQLEKAIATSIDLNQKLKTKALKQVQLLAKAALKPTDERLIDAAEDANTMLSGIISLLPSDAKIVATSKELLPAIAELLGI